MLPVFALTVRSSSFFFDFSSVISTMVFGALARASCCAFTKVVFASFQSKDSPVFIFCFADFLSWNCCKYVRIVPTTASMAKTSLSPEQKTLYP